jgi:hypothetical protein
MRVVTVFFADVWCDLLCQQAVSVRRCLESKNICHVFCGSLSGMRKQADGLMMEQVGLRDTFWNTVVYHIDIRL